VCPTALVIPHLTAETFADLTDLFFVSSAEAEGERIREVAMTATTTRFI
jgi:hypothetical protein